MSNSGLTLRGKLFAMTAATVIALAALFVVLLLNSKSQMLEDRQAKVRNLVEVAHATVAHFEKAARDGQMPVEEAQQKAAAAIRSMRYDTVEYFWINNLQDLMVMHPIK